MKAIILAAGYATRLYPLTKNQPKPLLEVGGKSILDHIVEKMDKVDELDQVFIVTNNKFATHFEEWKSTTGYQLELTIVNDGTLSNDTRLGALGDIQYVINTQDVQDDLMIVAGDNLFGFELTDFVDFYKEKDNNVISLYKEPNPDQLIRGGTADLDESGQVIGFEEKPPAVNYPYSVPTFYVIKQDYIGLINDYIQAGNNADANGNFIPYLLDHAKVYGFVFEDYRYDIGTLESYEAVQKIFNK